MIKDWKQKKEPRKLKATWSELDLSHLNTPTVEKAELIELKIIQHDLQQ